LAGATLRLADAGFGQFNRDAQVDLAQKLVQPGIAGLLVQPLGRDLEARERGAVQAAIEQPKLERIAVISIPLVQKNRQINPPAEA
jgi:hypothetical protein